jgi:hypothetical protein
MEQELWNLVFKSQINYFQTQIKENSAASSSSSGLPTVPTSNKTLSAQKKLEAQTSLAVFLESARGFYTKLLEDLIIKHNLSEQENTSLNCLPFSPRFRSIQDCIVAAGETQEAILAHSTKEKQILYICQHTLTHLGDIARYANYYNEAKNYYLHATKLVPYLGQSYNQLGILFETMRTNQLATVFYYIRSIATKYTFPLASTNLENFYMKLIEIPLNRYSPLINNSDLTASLKQVGKLASKDLLTLFLQINSIVYTCLFGSSRGSGSSKVNNIASNYNNNAGKLALYFELFKHSFTSFIQSASTFLLQQRDKIDFHHFYQMTVIVLFSLSYVDKPASSKDSATSTKRSNNTRTAWTTSIELFVLIVEQFVSFYNLHSKSPTSETSNGSGNHLGELVLPSLYLAFSYMESFRDEYLFRDNRIWRLSAGKEDVKAGQFCASVIKMLNSLDSKYREDLKAWSSQGDPGSKGSF